MPRATAQNRAIYTEIRTFYTKNEEFYLKNDESCTKNDGVCRWRMIFKSNGGDTFQYNSALWRCENALFFILEKWRLSIESMLIL